jgi:hypothetical protein
MMSLGLQHRQFKNRHKTGQTLYAHIEDRTLSGIFTYSQADAVDRRAWRHPEPLERGGKEKTRLSVVVPNMTRSSPTSSPTQMDIILSECNLFRFKWNNETYN